ncbi:MAG: hypothetical protein RRY29_11280 [Desulfovibrionaceae bacterium]
MCKKTSVRRQKRLLDALELRLDALTENLAVAQVADKGIDMVKEIKELHTILKAVREGDKAPEGAAASPTRVILMWGNDAGQGGE